MDTLDDFGNMSGFRLNLNESTLIFPSKMSHLIREDLSATFNLKASTYFGKYLGVHISPNRLKITNFTDFI